MSVLDNITKLFRQTPQVPVLTKAPGFAVTQFTSNNPFTNLIEPESNYFNQYILYTYKAIDYVSSKVASSKFKLYNISDDQEVKNNDLFEDLKNFNPYMNLWEARKIREIHLDLTGAAYWYIDRDPQQNRKAEFYILDPNHMQMKSDSRGLPAYWAYTDADGKVIYLEPEDIIYFRRINPKNWFEGLSKVKQLEFWTNAYAQGAQYNMSKLGNNTNVDKFIVFEGIDPAQKEKIELQMREKYGGARNAGRTGVVAVEPKVVDVSSNQKDLDYVEGMKMLRQDILAAFGIPEALFFPSATNANSKEAITLFQRDTLEPLLEQEMAVLNEQLIRKYEQRVITKVTTYFKFDNVVDKDKDELVEQAKKLVESGIYTRNQALKYIGDEPVSGGDIYINGNSNPQPMDEEEAKGLYQKTLQLKEQLDGLIKQQERTEFIEKSIKLADEQEGIMYASAESLFQDQFKRAIEYINKTDNPTIRGIFNFKEEKEITKSVFKESYAKIIANSNDVGNVEIKQKLLKNNSSKSVNYKHKSISGEAIDEIAKKLEYFADELNTVTRDKLRKIIAEGKDKGFDTEQFRQSIEDLFNEFIDGQKNIDMLRKHGLYIESISVDSEGNTSTASGNRYRQMLSNITQADLTKLEKDEALKALRGLIDPSDPIGKEVDALLSSVYQVNKNKEISRSRAVTIARTESTFARNLGFNDVYNDNPFVTKKMWNSLHDQDVRDSHAKLDGTAVDINKAFQADGGKLRFPGDTLLGAGAEEIVNCRCRITAEVE